MPLPRHVALRRVQYVAECRANNSIILYSSDVNRKNVSYNIELLPRLCGLSITPKFTDIKLLAIHSRQYTHSMCFCYANQYLRIKFCVDVISEPKQQD